MWGGALAGEGHRDDPGHALPVTEGRAEPERTGRGLFRRRRAWAVALSGGTLVVFALAGALLAAPRELASVRLAQLSLGWWAAAAAAAFGVLVLALRRS